ncbi:hypothetical protein A3D85_03105 [Candidatus Amesbacteria bacterium RIFCSPHIGHO2_02_FULL_47_9]|nr:MAG: hypothetical protein A3D85_03105 [Candidatus Amesbacteria bacterium RIFCSPHIGHO2_02_FULL_47_9]
MKRPELKLPTILGILVVALGMVSGLVLLRSPLGLISKAAEEEVPREVRVTNQTDNSLTISWITQEAASGYVQYGEAEAAMDLTISDDRDQEKGEVGKYFSHYVTVRGLKPEQGYIFKIGSGSKLFGQGEGAYETRTGVVIGDTPTADVAYGQVIGSGGDPAEGAIVYLNLAGGSGASALVKPSGAWVISLATMRKEDLSAYLEYDREEEIEELNVTGGGETAQAKVKTGGDSPVPVITLGGTYDFTQETATLTPEAGEEISSKFSQESLVESEQTEAELQVLSPKLGEQINSARPVIIGKAPKGSKVTIEVNSTAKVVTVINADSSGDFVFEVPNNLEPGKHQVTVSTIIDGVLQTVTREFVVYAAEDGVPAFSATPSGELTITPTLKPSPTAVPTVAVTSTPAPTAAAATPTAIPTEAFKVAMPATDEGVPVSGNQEWTWWWLVLGGVMLAGGGDLYSRNGKRPVK